MKRREDRRDGEYLVWQIWEGKLSKKKRRRHE